MCEHPLRVLDTIESITPERVVTELYCPVCDIVVKTFVATVANNGDIETEEF